LLRNVSELLFENRRHTQEVNTGFAYRLLGLLFCPEDGDTMLFRNFRDLTTHNRASKRIIFFIVTAVKTSNTVSNLLNV
jgi:hypothetical protein